jgi:predicted O-methyltransferase YrrM
MNELVNWSSDGKLFMHPPGQEHYRLLMLISQLLVPGSKILEIGTRWGVSAVALASNKSVHVVTCDLEDQLGDHDDMRNIENISYVIADGYDMLDNCHEYQFIFIDVDPHDGIQERKMIQKLIDLNYNG